MPTRDILALHLYEARVNLVRNHKSLGSGGSMVARVKLKGIDGGAPQGMDSAAQFDSTRENLPGPDT